MQKFVANSKSLKNALGIAYKVINKNPIIPVLENFHMAVIGNTLHITGGNNRDFISTKLEVDAEEDMEVLVPTDVLTLLTQLPEQTVEFQLEVYQAENEFPNQKSFTLTIVHDNGFYTLECEDPQYYIRSPVVRQPIEYYFHEEFLSHCAEAGKYCHPDEVNNFRFLLIRIQENRIMTAGCDRSNIYVVMGDFDGYSPVDLLFSPGSIKTIQSVISGQCSVRIGDRNVIFSDSNTSVTCQLMEAEGAYPDYEELFHGYLDNITNQVLVSTGEMAASLNRLHSYASDLTTFTSGTAKITKKEIILETTRGLNATPGKETVPLEDSVRHDSDITLGMHIPKVIAFFKTFYTPNGLCRLSITKNAFFFQEDQKGEVFTKIGMSMGKITV